MIEPHHVRSGSPERFGFAAVGAGAPRNHASSHRRPVSGKKIAEIQERCRCPSRAAALERVLLVLFRASLSKAPLGRVTLSRRGCLLEPPHRSMFAGDPLAAWFDCPMCRIGAVRAGFRPKRTGHVESRPCYLTMPQYCVLHSTLASSVRSTPLDCTVGQFFRLLSRGHLVCRLEPSIASRNPF